MTEDVVISVLPDEVIVLSLPEVKQAIKDYIKKHKRVDIGNNTLWQFNLTYSNFAKVGYKL